MTEEKILTPIAKEKEQMKRDLDAKAESLITMIICNSEKISDLENDNRELETKLLALYETTSAETIPGLND
jgi:hypothetical protein